MRPQDVEHLSTKPLDWDELWDEDEQRYRVQTRDGRKVRIYTINGMHPERPIVGETDTYNGEGVVRRWRRDGRWLCDVRNLDLIPEPRTVRRWGPYISGTVSPLYRTEEAAEYNWPGSIIAYVEWEE